MIAYNKRVGFFAIDRRQPIRHGQLELAVCLACCEFDGQRFGIHFTVQHIGKRRGQAFACDLRKGIRVRLEHLSPHACAEFRPKNTLAG
jgi:hypothetical protein